MFDDFEVIYSYTTQDALDDGTLIDAATHPDLSTVTLLTWNVDRIRIIISSGLLAVLQEAGNVGADWQRINSQFIQENHHKSDNLTELTLLIGGIPVRVWVGCEPFGPDDPTPKITYFLPQEY